MVVGFHIGWCRERACAEKVQRPGSLVHREGTACAKVLRQEEAWDGLGMEIQVAHMEYDRKQSW